MNGHPDETVSPGVSAVTVVDDAGAYATLAQSVGPDLALVPVLSRVRGEGAPTRIPGPTAATPDPRAWQGVVVVTEDEFESVGLVLARGSGRPMRRADLAEAVRLSLDVPVTVVCSVNGLSSAVIAALPTDARLGFFVAPDPASASGLAARTLLQGPTVAAESPDLLLDMLTDDTGPDRLAGPDATVDGVRAATRDGVAILAARAHARNCAMDLLGGTLCGRLEERPLLPVEPVRPDRWSGHPTACQQSALCCRYGNKIRDNLRAADVAAAFAIFDSCRIPAAGDSSVRSNVSIPLTMLANSTLAVACGVGTRAGSDWAAPLLRGLLRAGLALGTALVEVNQAIEADPRGMGRLILYGDAGLVPVPGVTPVRLPASAEGTAEIPSGPAAVMVEGTALMPVHPGGPVVVSRTDGRTSWALTDAFARSAGPVAPAPGPLDRLWQDEFRPWSQRLRELAEIGLQLDGDRLDAHERAARAAVRHRAGAEHLAAARQATEAYATARAGLVAVQHDVIVRELTSVAGSFYHFLAGWPEPLQVISADGAEQCPQCGDATANRHYVVPGGGTGARLCYVVCSRCGEVLAGAAEFPVAVRVSAPTEVACGERFRLAVEVTAPADRSAAVTVGAAFRRQDLLRCRLNGITSVELPAGAVHTVELTGDSDRERTIPDVHNITVLVAVEGSVRCITRAVWLRAQRS